MIYRRKDIDGSPRAARRCFDEAALKKDFRWFANDADLKCR
jgi:hypothetical protein